MIRVILADDHELVRAGLCRLLNDEPDIDVVAELSDANMIPVALAEHDADVLVLDISMPGPGVFSVLNEIRERCPHCRVVVLSMHPEEAYAAPVFKAGAAAYLTKDTSSSHLVAAVRRAHEGGTYVTGSVAQLLAAEIANPKPADPLSQLSKREREVLRLLARGYSSKRIAVTLLLSPKTVSTYRSRLLEKLNLETTADLIRFAISHGLGE